LKRNGNFEQSPHPKGRPTQAFANSEDLKSAMQNAGVVGAPTIWFTNKV